MGSICIPVIDMKEDSVGQSEKIVEACREWGCFRIINHGVPPELMAEMKAATQSLMELPVEIKWRRYHPVEGYGYIPVNRISPVYESLVACNDSCVPGALDNFLDLMAVSPHLRCMKHATSKDIAWEARGWQTFVVLLSFVVLHVISRQGLNVYSS